MNRDFANFILLFGAALSACDADDIASVPMPDSGLAIGGPPDAIVDYTPIAMLEHQPPLPATRCHARSVRLRVWNSVTSSGERTQIGLEDAMALVESTQLALTQCEDYGWPIDVVLESVGTVSMPEQCYLLQTTRRYGACAQTGGPHCFIQRCPCARYIFGNMCDHNDKPPGAIGSIGRRINGFVPDQSNLVHVPDALEKDEPGQVDVVFVRRLIPRMTAQLEGLAGGNPSRTALFDESQLRENPTGYFLTIGHELGHCAGG